MFYQLTKILFKIYFKSQLNIRKQILIKKSVSFFLKKIVLLHLKTMIVIETINNTIEKTVIKTISQMYESSYKNRYSNSIIISNCFQILQPN